MDVNMVFISTYRAACIFIVVCMLSSQTSIASSLHIQGGQVVAPVTVDEETEILLDLIESTSKIAYRMNVLAQFEHFNILGQARKTGFNQAYEAKRAAAFHHVVIGSLTFLSGMVALYIASTTRIGDGLLGPVGSWSLALGATSVIHGSSYGPGGQVLDVDEADLAALDMELFNISIRSYAKETVGQCLEIAGLEDIDTLQRVNLEQQITAAMKDNLVRISPRVTAFGQPSEEEKYEIDRKRRQIYIKPFSVASILKENGIISQKQKAALEAVMKARSNVAPKESKQSMARSETWFLIKEQLKKSKEALLVVQEVLAESKGQADKSELSRELKALSGAIAESEEYLEELKVL